MQEAEAIMARDKGVPVIQLRLDTEVYTIYHDNFQRVVQAAAERMKTAPTAKERILTEQQSNGWKLPAGHEWAPVEISP